MKILDKESGSEFEAIIEKVAESDYSEIKRDKGFIFNWSLEKEYEVYKLYLKDEEGRILGLLSVIDNQSELRLHINLIEVTRGNVGRIKKLDNIAGCLIAFACSIAFKRGYGGFVSLLPKTKLVDLYQNKYGFRQYGRLLAVEFESSKYLVDKYIGSE
ncbi:MAG: hypothetical protein J5I94_08975 [Phaeodactylibacter sp.]|nr:hypothetical protein [Phaeodactylibacter sp.]